MALSHDRKPRVLIALTRGTNGNLRLVVHPAVAALIFAAVLGTAHAPIASLIGKLFK